MLGILDHNLTTVSIPLLEDEISPQLSTKDDRRGKRDDSDTRTFGGNVSIDLFPRDRSDGRERLATSSSYRANRLSSETGESLGSSPGSALSNKLPHRSSVSAISAALPTVPRGQTLEIRRETIRGVSPAPSSLSLNRKNPRAPEDRPRPAMPSSAMDTESLAASLSEAQTLQLSVPAIRTSDGTESITSTPRLGPVGSKRSASRSGLGTFASRFGQNWLFGALGGRSQPSFPVEIIETVARQDVVPVINLPPTYNETSERKPPQAVLQIPIVTPSTPSPAEEPPGAPAVAEAHSAMAQPVPIASRPRVSRMATEDDVRPHSQRYGSSFKGISSVGDSWSRSLQKGFVTVNPCLPTDVEASAAEGRRWQHVRPNAVKALHVVQWTSLSAPACLPLTTDFVPTPSEVQEFYEVSNYDIACLPEQASFLIRPDAAYANQPLAVMREMASQRLSRE